jgi:hypothetical protein
VLARITWAPDAERCQLGALGEVVLCSIALGLVLMRHAVLQVADFRLVGTRVRQAGQQQQHAGKQSWARHRGSGRQKASQLWVPAARSG